jgi:hypothetical protein
MRVTGLKVALFLSALVGMISVGEYSLLNAAHASTTGSASTLHTVSRANLQTASLNVKADAHTVATSRPAVDDSCESYVQVFDEIDEDPEHAQARMVTASYDINN